uniref:Uncharacterized protein n=1 Tax=Candidatus Methanogaster sp. ANME-2c ERB4 TaxID=2759911 RepID=A0A7G9YAQ6_9EURY|nr:hypothetical protein KNJBMNFM_00001 [Methanosarcinales archaeon ANME-2c ERB4]
MVEIDACVSLIRAGYAVCDDCGVTILTSRQNRSGRRAPWIVRSQSLDIVRIIQPLKERVIGVVQHENPDCIVHIPCNLSHPEQLCQTCVVRRTRIECSRGCDDPVTVLYVPADCRYLIVCELPTASIPCARDYEQIGATDGDIVVCYILHVKRRIIDIDEIIAV